VTRGHQDVGPAWSPNGDSIAFYRGQFFVPGRPSKSCYSCVGIWIINADGSGLNHVVAG